MSSNLAPASAEQQPAEAAKVPSSRGRSGALQRSISTVGALPRWHAWPACCLAAAAPCRTAASCMRACSTYFDAPVPGFFPSAILYSRSIPAGERAGKELRKISRTAARGAAAGKAQFECFETRCYPEQPLICELVALALGGRGAQCTGVVQESAQGAAALRACRSRRCAPWPAQPPVNN